MIDRIEDALPVEPYMGIQSDFFGNTTNGMRIPGPFASLESDKVYSVDPRKTADS